MRKAPRPPLWRHLRGVAPALCGSSTNATLHGFFVMATPHALILRAPGTNCDHEVQVAFEMVGGRGTRMHMNALRDNPRQLRDYQILVLPGGFSYGDDVAA